MKNNPIKQLSEDDLSRKEIKLKKIKDQMNPEHEDYRANPKKQERLKEKLHTTDWQIRNRDRGRPVSLKNQAWLAGK